MISFSIKTKAGREVLGIALGAEDIAHLQKGAKILFDLDSVNVGLWRKEADGSRSFLQPRESQVFLVAGETTEEIGEAIGVSSLPSLEELRRLSGKEKR